MKKANSFITISILTISVIAIFPLISCFAKRDNQLVYDYKHSCYDEFYLQNGNVVFKDEIRVKNTTSKDLYFYMSADVSQDRGLVVENTAIACKLNSLLREKFFIKANSEQLYTVYFKAKKGEKNSKLNMLPPKQVRFEILNTGEDKETNANLNSIQNGDIYQYSLYLNRKIPDKGHVPDAKTARKLAEEILYPIYGDSINEDKPFIVKFDDKNQAWIVEGQLPEKYDVGGVPYVIIQKSDGKVLAVWHTK